MATCNMPRSRRADGLRALVALVVLIFASPQWMPESLAADAVAQQFDTETRRETDASPGIPTISFVDSLTASCYGPLAEINACYIQWASLSVSATSPQYIDRMTVSIDGRVRAVYSGFFQTSMVVPPGMHREGFKVACGIAGASGDPASGIYYSYVIRASETAGLSSTNYGTAVCPADYRLDLIFRNGFDPGSF